LSYTVDIVAPSVTAYALNEIGNLPFDYYSSPWEAEADVLGGVSRGTFDRPWTEKYSTVWDLIPLFVSK